MGRLIHKGLRRSRGWSEKEVRRYLYLKLAKQAVLISVSEGSEWERPWPLAESGPAERV